MDKITLSGARVFTHVGCTVEERRVGQHLEIDFTLEGDFAAAGREDDLAASVDYAAALVAVSDAVSGHEAKLIETIAERAATALLALPNVRAATVRVRKEAPPIPRGHARYAEIEIRREGKAF